MVANELHTRKEVVQLVDSAGTTPVVRDSESSGGAAAAEIESLLIPELQARHTAFIRKGKE